MNSRKIDFDNLKSKITKKQKDFIDKFCPDVIAELLTKEKASEIISETIERWAEPPEILDLYGPWDDGWPDN